MATAVGARAQIVVINTNDSGPGSLRQALVDASAACSNPASTATPDITFNIPGTGPFVIKPATPLPPLDCTSTLIDGYSQPGAYRNGNSSGGTDANLLIAIDGSSCGASCNGLEVNTDSVDIEGLAIHSFQGSGIYFVTATAEGILYLGGNYIGTDPGGMNALGNGNAGIRVEGLGLLFLGAPFSPDYANLVSNNGVAGVYLASGATADLEGNLIGGKRDGSAGNGNGGPGVVFAGGSSTDLNDLADNYIRYNNGPGVQVFAQMVDIEHNFIYGNTGKGIENPGGPPAPVVTSVVFGGVSTTIVVQVTGGPPNTDVNIEAFHNASLPTVTEGQEPVANGPVTLDASGNGSITLTAVEFNAQNVTATMTSSACGCGDTSEFSQPYIPPVAPQATVAFNPTSLLIGQSGTMSVVVRNPNTTWTMTGIAYDFAFPSPLQGAFSNIQADCGTGYTAGVGAGGSGASIRNVSLAPGGTCTVVLGVQSPSAGTFTIPASYLSVSSSLGAGTNATSAALTVTTPPVMTLSASSVSFGNVPTGTTASAAFTLSNTGGSPLVPSHIIASTSSPGASPNVFSLTHDCPASLAAGAACTVTVFFTPVASTAYTGTIEIDANVSSSPAFVSLSGAGVAPAVQLSPPSLTFAGQPMGTTSAAQSVTLTNTGNATLAITSITGTGDFAISGCAVTTLAPSATCTLSATFSPTATGTRTGSIQIVDNASGSPHSVALTGTGAPALAPAMQVSPPALTFSAQPMGTTSAAQSVTLTNTGTATLTISSITPSGDFAASGCAAATLAPSASCTLSVKFSPTATGTRTGSIQVVDNAAGSPHSVTLSGTGSPALSPIVQLSSSSLAFAVQAPGTVSAAQSIVITNTGTAALNIGAIAVTGEFAATGCAAPISLPVSGACTLSVTFSPSSGGPKTGSILVTSDAAGSPHAITLSGTGGTPAVQLSAASLTFTTQAVGTTSAAQSVVVTNNGSAPLSMASITASGDFAVTGCAVSSVAVSASCTLSITFTPTATGARSGSIAIATNASTSPDSIALAGTGGAPAVQLSSTSLAFVRQTVGTTSPAQDVVLTNTGTTPLHIANIAAAGDFGYSGCGFPLVLAPNVSCTFAITFSPLSAGILDGSISIASDAPGSPHAIALAGTGVLAAVPALSVQPFSVAFGAVRVGSQATQHVTLTSIGAAPLSISSIAVSGAFFADSDDCPATLPIGASCDVALTYSPTSEGSHLGQLAIVSNGEPATFAVPLSGSGISVPPPLLSVDRFVDFGQRVVSTEARQSIALRNIGGDTLVVTRLDVLGPGFRVEGTCGAIEPGGHCDITIVFQAASPGTFTGRLDIVSNSSDGVAQVDLLGQGVVAPQPTISLSVNGIGFANQMIGTQGLPVQVTLSSVGNAPVHIAGISASLHFNVATNGCPAVLPPGNHCHVLVAFFPLFPGFQQGQLTVASDDTASRGFVSLTGTGCRFFSVSGMRNLMPQCAP